MSTIYYVYHESLGNILMPTTILFFSKEGKEITSISNNPALSLIRIHVISYLQTGFFIISHCGNVHIIFK